MRKDTTAASHRRIVRRTLIAGALAVSTFSASLPGQAANFNAKDTSVQMFRWKWNDIAKECTDFLGPQGYGAVQVSPPHASASLNAWYDVYQPVNFTSLKSNMGTEAEFQSMINTCHAAKVRVYADVVVNHMAAGSGTATDGSTWNSATLQYPYFSASDFHPACDIAPSDYNNNRYNVMFCRLVGLPDLQTEGTYVRGQVKNYLNKLLGMGVDGFRFDAAKHMQPTDLQAFVTSVSSTTAAGEPVWVTQEIISDATVNRADYFPSGTINEFKFATAMRETFRSTNGNQLSQIRAYMGTPGNWGGTWGFVDSPKATVFVNNWDTERSGDSMNASNFTGVTNDTQGTKRYDLANIFMLAWPYGHAQVHSGFRFSNKDQNAPAASPYDASGNPKINVDWDFIHRWSDIANMVAFRAATSGQGVANFTNGTINQIAFSRGAVGFVAINNEYSAWNPSLQTGLPAGTYCNVVHGQLNAAKTACTGDSVTIGSDGIAALSIVANGGATVPAVALYLNQKVTGATCTTVDVKFRVANANTVVGQNVYVVGNRNELSNWTPTTSMTIEGSGANVPWSRIIQLPPSTAIQYKFMKHGAVADVWESNQATGSGNREAVTPACGAAMLVLDAGSFKF
ncbi:alpha amylase C-terminal domain-containing protein [Undibacterium sp. Jales W-56]|uniref:carbohydrate-binding module family 20 domain-containing protein n=1 Tax=Undibacterium sp. Jales W-56 TaxID=2897325 RepID=UPI0021D15F90|nr:alpha-amylase family glycosyl hydrolase [Undibacterium sp. Jales W-56]MCU6435709.1 alpha amylase C-terminal domain-containing protein [Undibacterium sp. Jales W-56]